MEPGQEDDEAPVRQPKAIDLGIDLTQFRDVLEREPGITLDELEVPGPRHGVLGRLKNLRLRFMEDVRTTRMRVRTLWQRSVRGWADVDWWELDTHLCQNLGRLLIVSAERGRSYPASHSLESWQTELRVHGQALVDYDGTDAERVAAARRALRWVTTNLTLLWD